MTTGVSKQQDSTASSEKRSSQSSGRWFTLPSPVRRVFERFPLRIYTSNPLPHRSPQRRDQHNLYVFTVSSDELPDRPSFNPLCLKWQAFLKFSKIDFAINPANNHASPSGTLPFLLPATRTPSRPTSPVSANKLAKWVAAQSGHDDSEPMRDEAYITLLDHSVRDLWVFTVYLDEANFDHVALPWYVHSASTNIAVRFALAAQLRQAARAELLKRSISIDEKELLLHADEAFKALSAALGEKNSFAGNRQPGLLDAAVFAYTHLLLHDEIDWQDAEMVKVLKQYPNLVRHRSNLMQRYFTS